MKSVIIIFSFLLLQFIAIGHKPMAREIGIPFEGGTGKFSAITDVAGRGDNGSGDIFIAFSAANPSAFQRDKFSQVTELPDDLINPLFKPSWVRKIFKSIRQICVGR